MLIKEYRIPLPLTVEEYRIAQLYMIAKKSRDESKGVGSGVEILVNEPYEEGPGGKGGQYTRKVYHIGSHLPGWIKSLIPKSALTVEEEAWNAYPYTKTRYTSLFIEKFFIEIETYYYPDDGNQDNVFGLSGSDLRNRTVDLIDVVKDQTYGADYIKEEDPKLFISEKTGRGPLSENWLQQYWTECKGKKMPTSNGMSIMCAYKLCRVEFRYWGVQSKLEKFIDDVALRKTMLRAHRQAWVWQDEWYGLTMEDIRKIERETQEALKAKMGLEDGSDEEGSSSLGAVKTSESEKNLTSALGSIENNTESPKPIPRGEGTSKHAGKSDEDGRSLDLNIPRNQKERSPLLDGHRKKWSRSNSKGTLHSPTGSGKGFDVNIDKWRMESLRRDSDSGSDDEFFDCQEDVANSSSLVKWSSLDLLTEDEMLDVASPTTSTDAKDSIFSHAFLQRMASEKGNRPHLNKVTGEISCPGSPISLPACTTSVLIFVLHAGSVLDANVDLTAKKSDMTTFRGVFETVMRQHYPSVVGHIIIKLVSCSSICTEALGVLSSLSPYSFDVSPSSNDAPHVTNDSIPVGAIPLFACSSIEYQDSVTKAISACNSAYQDFIKSDEGKGFSGQIVLIGDSVGSILAYDALCRSCQNSSLHDSENSILDADIEIHDIVQGQGVMLEPRRSSTNSEQTTFSKLDFEVSDLFMFGSPLSLVLAYRKILKDEKNTPIPRPGTCQVYNLFHPTDPVATRLEPLISARFSVIPPINVARYQKYPLGDGQPYHLLELIQSHPQWFSEGSNLSASHSASHIRRMSEISLQSTLSGFMDGLPLQNISSITQKWWGTKRLDYALYCPEGLSSFPTNALPHLFHASYWESVDVIAFVLRQICRFDLPTFNNEEKEMSLFSPSQPREKWIKKKTSVKLKNVAANHRANDVIIREGAPQILVARFMYGPLDMITLTGEKVDVHIMKNYPGGEWIYLGTEITDKTGRVYYRVPPDKAVTYGIYPIKMIVRGDHTSADFYLVVVPPKTECVVFSIDGSFTASVSVTGKDPKVRAGAVDVVRHWQELGYFIIYITGRPDMQQQKVMSWLSQHNFPHGFIYFVDGLSRFPLVHKADYLKSLMQEHDIVFHAAYGSAKDVTVYTSLGLKPKQIFIVGKASKKLHSQATILSDGYASHLTTLMAHGGSRPAQGNARMVIPRGYFGLPGQNASLRRRSGKSGIPCPVVTDSGDGHHQVATRRKVMRPPLSAPVDRV
ncbi:hypothetical protein RUM44_008626 [Polyplax serrata]|uniref:DDHD domain-containing protein n=1 Tax=Polyplax serrata TaxID=468196 RepID=A0ABR1B8S2_POLSC